MPSRWSVWALFAYGLVLGVFGVMVSGAGHGSYLLLWLAGSPFSLLLLAASSFTVYCLPVVIVVSILQWGLLALAQRRQYVGFRVVAAFLLVHYAVAVFLIFGNSRQVEDWEYLRMSPPEVHLMFVSGLAFYAIGQCIVWGASLPKRKR